MLPVPFVALGASPDCARLPGRSGDGNRLAAGLLYDNYAVAGSSGAAGEERVAVPGGAFVC